MWSSDFTSKNPEVTDALVSQVEAALQVKLPRSYIDLMKKKNGAYLEEQLVKINEVITGNISRYVSDGYVSLGSISGISLDEDNIHSIMSTKKMIKEWQLPDKLILLDGDGHTWTALDYRGASEDPPIIFIESDGNSFNRIAKNFEELLNKMIPFTEVYDSDGELRED